MITEDYTILVYALIIILLFLFLVVMEILGMAVH
jgi:hypothetical protein